jgi:hypothetical protein
MTLDPWQWFCATSLCAIPAALIWSFVAPMLRKARHLRAQAEYRRVRGHTPNAKFSNSDSGVGGRL